jgi:uncharacterized protein
VGVIRILAAGFALAALIAGLAPPAVAKDAASATIVIRAGRPDSPNHTLARQFAEAVALAENGAMTLDVQESQGSVENVIEATKRDGDYVFTATPVLIAQARRGDKPFAKNKRYNEIRALFPIPFQTVHWLVRDDSGVRNLADLRGHSFVPGGKGGLSERATVTALQVLGIETPVQLIDIDAAGAPAALLANKVSGMALTGPYPMQAVTDLARQTPVRLAKLTPAQLKKILAADDSFAAETVPKGTYPGIDEDVVTIALPAGAYTTERMSDATAYAITKAFWTERSSLINRSPAWQSVTPARLAALGARLHKGALRYYREAGVKLPASVR